MKAKPKASDRYGRVTVTTDFSTVRVFIDGLIHAYIVKAKFNGFSSYMQDGIYYVEIVFDTKRLLLCHEDRVLWTDILRGLNEYL